MKWSQINNARGCLATVDAESDESDEERWTERSQRTKSGKFAGRREKINWKRMEMTETSEEEESEKRWDEDEMNGYDEETIRDGTDKT